MWACQDLKTFPLKWLNEFVQQLRALTALSEEPDMIPKTHIGPNYL